MAYGLTRKRCKQSPSGHDHGTLQRSALSSQERRQSDDVIFSQEEIEDYTAVKRHCQDRHVDQTVLERLVRVLSSKTPVETSVLLRELVQRSSYLSKRPNVTVAFRNDSACRDAISIKFRLDGSFQRPPSTSIY